jgi:tryptophan synthase alpha chain
MNRINSLFQKLKKKGEGALICYLPVISAEPQQSMEVADIYAREGVDLIELGLPSLKPWLDGRVIQKAHLNAWEQQVTIDVVLDLGSRMRVKYPEWPIVPMTDYSEILRYGADRFVKNCLTADMDAVEIPDYPVFAEGDVHNLRYNLAKSNIQFVSFCEGIKQTDHISPEYHLFRKIVKGTSSFLFIMASPGVTGKRANLAAEYLKDAVQNVRKVQKVEKTDFPVVIGFGLSTPEQVSRVIKEVGADGAVIGSAVTELVLNNGSRKELADFICSVKQATRKNEN